MNVTTYLKRATRQIFMLILLVGLTFAAGMEWAQAATPEASGTMPGALHVVVLFLATIAFVVRAVTQAQKPARARARRRNRR